MSDAAILVIAADTTLRRSISFLLETEGCRVSALEAAPQQGESLDTFDCAVVDAKALASGIGDSALLGQLRCPVVLLGDRPLPDGNGVELVETPMLGPRLVEAVSRNVVSRRVAAPPIGSSFRGIDAPV